MMKNTNFKKIGIDEYLTSLFMFDMNCIAFEVDTEDFSNPLKHFLSGIIVGSLSFLMKQH